MGIDASIYQLAGRGVKSVQDYQNEAAQAQQNKLAGLLGQQKLQMGQMDMDQQKSTIDRTNRLNSVLSGFKADATPDDQVGQLTRGGFLPEARSLAESSAKVAKEKRDAEKAQLEGTSQKLQLVSQLLGGVKDQQSYDVARQTAQANGIDVSKLPPQYNPQLIQQKMIEGQTVKEQLEQVWKAKGYDLDVKKFGETVRNNLASDATSRANNANSNATARRGQDLTDSRARETTAAAVSKPFEVTGEDGKPVLVQQDKQGNIKPVQGYQPKATADKPLNDSQSKALLFGTRMQEANKTLEQLAQDGVTTSVPGSRTPIIGAAVNAVSSGGKQQLNQAKVDFMTAVLRRESGAAISSGEFDTAEKQYFPQVGDSPKVIEQKARNRQLAVQGVLQEVPEKQRGAITPKAAAPANVDSLLDKYK